MGGSGYGWKTAWFTQNPEESIKDTADFTFNDFSQLQQLLTNV